MRKRRLAIAAILVGTAVIVGLVWWHRPANPTDLGDLSTYNEQARHGIPANSAIEQIVYLDQGWSPAKVAYSIQNGYDQQIPLREKVPVYVTYFTLWVNNDGTVSTFGDLYGHDARMAAALRL